MLEFVEPADDDMPTDEERQLRDSNIDSDKEKVVDPQIEAEAYGPNDDDEDMDNA